MTQTAQHVVRITLTKEIQEALGKLKEIYPILSEAEIFKVALGSHFNQINSGNNASLSTQKNVKNNFQVLSAKIKKRTEGKYLGQKYNIAEMDKHTF